MESRKARPTRTIACVLHRSVAVSIGARPKCQRMVAQPRKATVRSSSSRQRSPAGGTPIGTRATAHMATAKPSPTSAADPSGMGRPATDDQCASMSPASQLYPALISRKATPIERQKRMAAGSSGASRHSRHTARTAMNPPTGRNVNEIASLPAPTVT
jgi:hypothetical protein